MKQKPDLKFSGVLELELRIFRGTDCLRLQSANISRIFAALGA